MAQTTVKGNDLVYKTDNPREKKAPSQNDVNGPGGKAGTVRLGRRNYVTPGDKRPGSPDSYMTSVSEKFTKQQHACTQNLGMAAAFFLPVALIACAVAVGTNYWFDISGDNVGLFRYCNNWTKTCSPISDKYSSDSTLKLVWQIGMPLEVAGTALLFVGLLCLLCYPCHRKVNFSKVACGIVVGILILVATLMLLGGSGIFTYFYIEKNKAHDMNWSLYIAYGSSGAALIASILFWIHVFCTCCCGR